MGVVYKLTFPDGKIYIGATRYSAEKRFEKHKKSSINPKTEVCKAISKFGHWWVKVEEIIKVEGYREMFALEAKLIKELESYKPDVGYNVGTIGRNYRKNLVAQAIQPNKANNKPESIMKHQDRIQAEKNYKAALAAAKKAESISESAWEKANAALETARKQLVQMEIKWPTNQEARREKEYLYLANRGLA